MSDHLRVTAADLAAAPSPTPITGPAYPTTAVTLGAHSAVDVDRDVEMDDPQADSPLAADPADAPPVDLRLLEPHQQRTFLQVHPERIALVTHVVDAPYSGEPPLLVVKDGPTRSEVTNLPAACARFICTQKFTYRDGWRKKITK